MGNKNLLAMYLDTINNALSVYHLKLLCITFISLAPLFENHRPKEGKGILMKVFSLTYFPEREGKEWKERESKRRERVDTRGKESRGGKRGGLEGRRLRKQAGTVFSEIYSKPSSNSCRW